MLRPYIQAGVLVSDAANRGQQYGWIINVLGVGQHRSGQCRGLVFGLLVAYIEHVFQFGIHSEYPLVKMSC